MLLLLRPCMASTVARHRTARLREHTSSSLQAAARRPTLVPLPSFGILFSNYFTKYWGVIDDPAGLGN